MCRDLKFALLNIQGLVTKCTNKLESDEVKTLFLNNDIIMFTEHWGCSFTNFAVNGFTFFELNRTEIKQNSKRLSGGIIIYIKDSLIKLNKNTELSIKRQDDDIIWLTLSPEYFWVDSTLHICLCYNVPAGSSREAMINSNMFDRLLNYVAELKSKYGDECSIMICGDLNARVSDMKDYVYEDNAHHMCPLPDDYIADRELGRGNTDNGINANGYLLIDFCKQTGLRIANGRVGRDAGVGECTFVGARGSSMVDYVLVSQDLLSKFSSFSIDEPNIISHHCTLFFSLIYNVSRSGANCNATEGNSPKIKSKYVWDKTLQADYIRNLSSEDTINTLNTITNKFCQEGNISDFDKNISNFVIALDGVCKPLFERKMHSESAQSKSSGTQYDETCDLNKVLFFEKLNNYRKDKNEINRSELVQARSKYKSSVRHFKYNCLKQKTQKLLDQKYKDAKQYWRLLKQSQNNDPPKSLSANQFMEYFQAVNNPDDHFYQADEDILHFNDRFVNDERDIMFLELDLPISSEEIHNGIKQLKLGKSGGPDRFINDFLIYGKDILSPFLKKIFNSLFDKGYFPTNWSEGFVVPIHKKGNINRVENYRGVTLLSVIGKLFTRILNNRLTQWVEDYYIYIEAQAGFRSGMGTTDNIFVLQGLITHMLNEGKRLYCGFVDFSKAFDYVNRDIIWYKLIHLGISGKMLNLIKSIYADIKSRVKYKNDLSASYDCYLGVRQGECLSPFLFAMYLNDIEDEFREEGAQGLDIGLMKLFLLLYADDIIIFSESAEGLQAGFDFLHSYCNRWKLKVNVDKTKVLIFRKGGTISRTQKFYYNEIEIDIVSSFSYLGIVFTPGGSFSQAQATLAGQAQKAVFKLKSYLYKLAELTPKHTLELFDKLVSPILNYSSEVWGFCQAKQIERVHLQFCKILLGVKQSTQNSFIYGELGRETFQTKRHFRIIKYWLKLLNAREHKYINIVYKMMLNDMLIYPEKKNWASLVKKLLSSLGFYEAWLNQGVGDQNLFLQNVNKDYVIHTYKIGKVI